MSNISIGELTVIADTGHTQCGDASAMARELLEYRKASKKPVGEIVAWGENIPPRQGINRKVDFRWLDVNVEPGTLLYAAPQLQPVSNPYTLPVVQLPAEFHSERGVVVQLEKVMAALAVHGIKYERRHQSVAGLRAGIESVRAAGIEVDADKITAGKCHK